MANTSTKWRIFAALAVLAIAALYLTRLTSMGMYSTDEPRYADIGRTMAHTGDWITPRLWGRPWFEKPPLLYWMTAAGFSLGLDADLAPRLPVALLSVAFLAFFWWRLRDLFDERAASCATAILATSGGWLAYSHVAVTDLPVAAFFSAAVLFALSPKDDTPPHRVAAAICLGLAVLAKSVPPLVLFTPVLFFDRRNWRHWFASWPIVAFLAIALPWHIIATIRNGWDLPYVLFIEQQFGRFLNSSRQHGQKWWFYLPVFLGLLFPWFTLLPLVFKKVSQDRRHRTLSTTVLLGLIFFSASINKLPGYVLPLIPATSVLLGIALARSQRQDRWLIAPVFLLGAFPLIALVVPPAAAEGLSDTPIPWIHVSGFAVAALAAGFVGFALRSRALPAAFLIVAGSFLWLEAAVFPALDFTATARPLWFSTRPQCAPVLARSRLFGLYYYSGKELPDCGIVDKNAGPAGGSVPIQRQIQNKQ